MDRDRLIGESVYSVFIRNHTATGDIKGLIDDLKRIKELGVSIIWILPHYPIGKINRKGKLGSPYAVRDYLSVNPELGSLYDFKELVNECHKLELKLVIDIVFNHTACDSVLVKEHPDWFVTMGTGDKIAKVPQWDDVYDLDFDNNEMKNYLINVLHYWADLGVDGFRCDVASIVPLSFWMMAKDTLSSDYKELIWIAESVEKTFISFIRHNGHVCHSDSELYNVFDILYDYDVQNTMIGYIKGEVNFDTFVNERQNQEVVYPKDYLKLRFLENHDSPQRAAELIKDNYHLINWKSFSMFERGVPMIYAGEEFKLSHKPDLFNSDKLDWAKGDEDYIHTIKTMLNIEHMYIVTNGVYNLNPLAEDCVHLRYRYNGETLHGIFNFGIKDRYIEIEVLQGEYVNILSGEKLIISDEKLNLKNSPYIFKSIP